MKYCKRCVMPDTKRGIFFDENGVCGACLHVERKKRTNWDERQKKLMELCDSIRGSNGNGYDCIVPVSGGKDGTYQTYLMSKIYKLKILCVNVSAHLQTYEGISNLNSMVENLGVDLIKVNVRPSIQKKIRYDAFFELGNPNYAEHQVVFAAVARTALFYKVPLVVWGEDIGAEFGGNVSTSSSDEGSAEDLINNDLFMDEDFDEFTRGRIDDNGLLFYRHPPKSEFDALNVKSIYLGHYHWWDGFKHLQIAKKFGFISRRDGNLSGNILDYDNIDEKLCELHIWFKFLKFGFWRPTDQSCYHIWNGRMLREEGVQNVLDKQYEFPSEYFNEFLHYHQMTESQFYECEDKYRNMDLWHKVDRKWRLKYEIH
jgi:N-acetyl sugar amidotransferase